MSEQFSLQPEEVESTNARLDSILDRLQALGASADAMKTAPLRPLTSVPDLPPSALEAPLVAEDSLLGTPPTELTPPNVPDLGIVAPVVETPIEAPADAAPGPLNAAVTKHLEAEPEPDAVAPHPMETIDQVEMVASVVEHEEIVETAGTIDRVETTEVATGDESEPPLVVSAPTSMFDLVAAPTEDPPVAEPEIEQALISASPDQRADDLDGWVSHHEVHGHDEAATERSEFFEEPEFPREELAEASFEALAIDDPTTPTSDDVEPSWADTTETSEPQVFDIAEYDLSEPEEQAVAFDVPSPEADGAEDFFASMNDSDEPVTIAGVDSMDTTELYETDDDLPLPDFTGVYAEAAVAESVESEFVLPDPVEATTTGSGAAVGRDELDRLRPAEEELAVQEKPARNLSLRLQFLCVLVFGILAVAVVLLNDPTAVDDMRRSIENLLG